MSPGSALISTSAEPLRSSSARVVASGTTLKRTLASLRGLAPVLIVALDQHLAIRRLGDEAERPGADRMPRQFFARAGGHNADRSVGEVPEQCRIGFLEPDDHGEFVGSFDPVDVAVGAGLWRSAALPFSRESSVHFTSAEVIGRPSWKRTPRRR